MARWMSWPVQMRVLCGSLTATDSRSVGRAQGFDGLGTTLGYSPASPRAARSRVFEAPSENFFWGYAQIAPQ